MNQEIKLEALRFRRIGQFGEAHPNVPAIAAAAASYLGVKNSVTQIEEYAENQLSGSGTVSGAVAQRLFIVSELRNLMGSLAKAAKTIDPIAHPEVASKMRLTGADSFEELLARANLFVSTVEPIKAEFIALGAADTVVEDLQALIDSLEGAGDLKLTGLDTQIGGTKGLEVIVRQGRKHARKLDAILCQVYRKNPVLLAQWKAAWKRPRTLSNEDPAPAPAAAPAPATAPTA